MIGRLGGDEFLVFVKDVTDKEILDRRMTQLFERLRSANSAPLSCSAGISLIEGKDFDYKEELRKADKALYESKKKGKNQYSHYEVMHEGKIFLFHLKSPKKYARGKNFLVPLKVTENFSSCIIYRTGESLIPACYECAMQERKVFQRLSFWWSRENFSLLHLPSSWAIPPAFTFRIKYSKIEQS